MTTTNDESAALNRDIDGHGEIDVVSTFGRTPRAYVDSLAPPRLTGRGEVLNHARVTPLRNAALLGRAVSPEKGPNQNQILAGLPLEDYQHLLARLEPVSLRPGLIVYRAGAAENDLYFPTEGIVSRYCVTRDGATTELAATGKEGVVGIASFLGGTAMVGEAVALTTGTAYRLRGDVVKVEFEQHRALARTLLRYTQALMAHMGQLSVCNRHHSLEQQLCRWLLSSLDRLTSNELTITHETIARMAGVRREGITRAATKLRDTGLIRYSRGRVTIINRRLLEAGACECHAVIKQIYQKLHEPSDNNANRSRQVASDSARSFARNRSPRVLPLRTIETL